MLAINSADDERNPPETGLMERALKRIKDAQYLFASGGNESSDVGRLERALFGLRFPDKKIRDYPFLTTFYPLW